jgi:hypothetical protein
MIAKTPLPVNPLGASFHPPRTLPAASVRQA